MTKGNQFKIHAVCPRILKIKWFCFAFFINLIFTAAGSAQEVFIVDPALSKIDCSVRYVAVGKYKAVFENFSGTIQFDPENIKESIVAIEINVDSIKSKHPRLDRFAKSKRLMDAKRYPKAVFHSQSIEKTAKGYKAVGMLNFRGVIREVSFPFTVDGPYMDYNKTSLIARGRLVVDRKHFNIIWNNILDYGGIIVANHIVLDWEMLGVR
jgi:polyisoprenoid-binding protein YceI